MPIEVDGAGIGNVEGSKKVQERALARSALSDHCEKLPFVNGQIDAAQDGNDVFPHSIAFVEVGNDHNFGADVSRLLITFSWERGVRREDATRGLRR